MAKRININVLVFSKVWHRDNFLGLGGLYNMYNQCRPVSSVSRYVMKGWHSLYQDGTHDHLIGVDERTTRAATINDNSPPLMDICKRWRGKLHRELTDANEKHERRLNRENLHDNLKMDTYLENFAFSRHLGRTIKAINQIQLLFPEKCNHRMSSQVNLVPFMLKIRPNKPQSLTIFGILRSIRCLWGQGTIF